MKIRDPKSKTEWNSLYEAWQFTCRRYRKCELGCPIYNHCRRAGKECAELFINSPFEAIQMLGYQTICDKPRLCEILGVKVDEPFRKKGEDTEYYIGIDGMFIADLQIHDWYNLCYMIQNPELVEHLHSWTLEDIEDAEAIRRCWPDAKTVKRDASATLTVRGNGGTVLVLLHNGLLSGLKCGDSAKLDDILEDKATLGASKTAKGDKK